MVDLSTLQLKPSIFLLAVNVMDEHAGAFRRHRHPLLPLERSPRVFVTALPVLTHGGAGKFVVPCVTFIRFLLVDDVQDHDLRQIRQFVQPLSIVIAELVWREFC